MKLSPEMRTIALKDRIMYNLLFMLQHVAPSSARVRRWRDDVRFRIARHLERGGKGKVIPVERVKQLTPQEFRTRYLATGTPVIIEKGGSDWPCSKKWSFESFRQRFGQATLKLVHHKGLSDDDIVLDQEFTEEMGFGDFLDQVLSGGMKYMRFSPILEMFPELVDDFDMKFLSEMPGKMSFGTTFEAFIGGKKTFTPLHNAPTPFFFVNVCGVKRWALIPNYYLPVLNPPADGMSYNHSGADVSRADPENFPGFESVDRMEALVQPGDLFFMPSWLWHSVQNETPTIGVRCGFMYPKSMFTEAPTLCLIRVFAARNPTLLQVLYYTLLKKNLPERKNMLLQPKIYWNFSPLRTLTDSPFVRRLVGGRATNPANHR
jgi:lysine-specific demethylase 8